MQLWAENAALWKPINHCNQDNGEADVQDHTQEEKEKRGKGGRRKERKKGEEGEEEEEETITLKYLKIKK